MQRGWSIGVSRRAGRRFWSRNGSSKSSSATIPIGWLPSDDARRGAAPVALMNTLTDLLRRHTSVGTRRKLSRIAGVARKPMRRRERRALGAYAPPVSLPDDVLDCVVAFNEH